MPYRLIISIIFLFLFSLAFAEKENQLFPPAQVRLSGEVFNFTIHADGSMYFYEEWVHGEVTLNTGESVEVEKLRYNGFLDQLIWLNPVNFQQIQVDKQLVQSFTLKLPHFEEELFFENITFKPWFETNPINIYGHVLYDGKIKLLAHRRVAKKGEVLENVGSALVARAELEPSPVFYILMPDNQAHAVRRFNRRTLYRIFPERADQIRSAFRKEHLRIRNENDLIKAIQIIDRLN